MLSGGSSRVTNLRKGISEKIESELPNFSGIDIDLIRNYLNGPVKWEWRSAAIHIYTSCQQ